MPWETVYCPQSPSVYSDIHQSVFFRLVCGLKSSPGHRLIWGVKVSCDLIIWSMAHSCCKSPPLVFDSQCQYHQKQKNLSYYKSWCMENPFSLFISIFSYAKEAYRTLAEQIVLNFRSLKLWGDFTLPPLVQDQLKLGRGKKPMSTPWLLNTLLRL